MMADLRPLDLSDGTRRLLLDESLCAYYFGEVSREPGRPVRHPENPVLLPDRPWEATTLAHGSVYRDPTSGTYRLWYEAARFFPQWEELGRTMCECGSVCYAESDDGIRWTKPSLGLVDFQGSRDNNIVFDADYYIDYPCVLLDEAEEDPSERYKILLYCNHPQRPGNYVFRSPDGIRWSQGRRLGQVHATDTSVLYRDRRTRDYLILTKYHDPKRVRTLTRSADLEHWTPQELILAADDRDPDQTDLYFLSVEPYEGMYIGLLGLYHYAPGREEIDVQLAYSYDATDWHRTIDRLGSFLSLGEEGEFDGKMIGVLGRGLVALEDKIRIYYVGFEGGHDVGIRKQRSAFGMVELRRDGFVALKGGDGGFVTPPAHWTEGMTLHVNCLCENEGHVRVDLVDLDDISGRTPLATGHVDGDRIDGVVPLTTTGNAMPRGPCRLRFRLKDARLYAFWAT
jgi:hypothetical protein